MSDAMESEFDTVALWTAEAAVALGRDHYIPAGCRGSGGPVTLHRLLDALDISSTDRMLDVGAGVGGPAAYARGERGVRPVLTDPESGACRAARQLFGLPTVRSSGSALPFPDGSFDVVWSLGVLCTTPDHGAFLRELRRVVADDGRVGLLVYVAQQELREKPQGNNFPDEDGLRAGLAVAGLEVVDEYDVGRPGDEPADWRRRAKAVERKVAAGHGSSSTWRAADEQAATMGRLIGDGQIAGRVLTLVTGRCDE